jgi:hypothetical protein
MEIEVAFRNDLEERFSVEVDFVVVAIGLIVDIRIGESRSKERYPLEMIRPFISLSRIVLTPCRRRMSPHFIFSWA